MNNVLSQLQDIQTPEPISYWPLAWGWWVVIVLTVLLLTLVIRAVIQYYKKRKALRAAIDILTNIDLTKEDALANINITLKRLALAYNHRQNVAKLQGKDWLNLLNQISGQNLFDDKFADITYQANPEAELVNEYYQVAQKWLKCASIKKLTQELSHV